MAAAAAEKYLLNLWTRPLWRVPSSGAGGTYFATLSRSFFSGIHQYVGLHSIIWYRVSLVYTDGRERLLPWSLSLSSSSDSSSSSVTGSVQWSTRLGGWIVLSQNEALERWMPRNDLNEILKYSVFDEIIQSTHMVKATFLQARSTLPDNRFL